MDDDLLPPTLQNLLDKRSLRWILVSGKGGVGKSTVSSSLSIELAKARKSVLIISTDPASNLSDAFGQKFGDSPTAVLGVERLFAMEVDPKKRVREMEAQTGAGANPMMQGLVNKLPGLDEAMYFMEIMKLVRSYEFETVVFDTAPTGHTLRMLQFHKSFDSPLFNMLDGGGGPFGGMLSSMLKMFDANLDEGMFKGQMGMFKELVGEVDRQFRNPELTTFVCVCIPEFLSLYETERLVQELATMEIDVQNIVINQIVFPESHDCALCASRAKMQRKYIDQVYLLYEDFHVVQMPLLKEEVRGVPALSEFAHMLLTEGRDARTIPAKGKEVQPQ